MLLGSLCDPGTTKKLFDSFLVKTVLPLYASFAIHCSLHNDHQLRNLLSREDLQARLDAETEPRTTLSFYRYAHISDPQALPG